jgi:hypothetical protein
MPEAVLREAILETDLVNLERLWQIPVSHRRSSLSLFPYRQWQERQSFSNGSCEISRYRVGKGLSYSS